MNIGCHAVLFKEKIKDDTENTIKMLASTSFAGSEIGARFFGTDDKDMLKSILKKNDYQLTGMHTGVALHLWDEQGKEFKDNILKAASFVSDMDNKNVIMSTRPFELSEYDEKDIIRAVKDIESIAQECESMGVSLNFHNHSWEFKDDDFVFNTLVKYAPTLNFGFDLGWLYAAGKDPIEMLNEYKDRINYVHLRDYDENKKFVDLGEGICDFFELKKVLDDVLDEKGWAVVEYEKGAEDINRYKKAYEYLKNCGY